MRTLLLDIETAPNVAHVWGLFKQTVSITQLMESSRVMCWAAKWVGEKVVLFDSEYRSSHKAMLRGVYALLDQADAVVHYNGSKFDIPTLNKEFLLHGLGRPSPYRQMDLLRVSRGEFRFPSNRLDYIAKALKLGEKTLHEGHELWVKCMNGDAAAWAKMERYNKNDVVLLDKVYQKYVPWMKNHVNMGLYTSELGCPNCGKTYFRGRGYAYTQAGKFQRYQCQLCMTWFRSNINEADKSRHVAL